MWFILEENNLVFVYNERIYVIIFIIENIFVFVDSENCIYKFFKRIMVNCSCFILRYINEDF